MTDVTKISVVNGAYSIMRISGLTTKASNEDIELALSVADDYAAQLKAQGLDTGWNQPSTYGESGANDISGVVPAVAGALKKLLALELSTAFGKMIPPSLAVTASEGMRAIENMLVTVPDAQFSSTLPRGSGNHWGYRDREYYPEPADNFEAIYVIKDDVLNHLKSFVQWLDGETLVSATWELANNSSAITIASQSITDDTASAELTFIRSGGYTVNITATKTNSTDRYTVTQNFVVRDAVAINAVDNA